MCSGLAAVMHNCKSLAQLAQQGPASLQTAVSKNVHVLTLTLICLQRCPLEYLRCMPAAQQQQHKALSQFFLTAGPQLLLGALAVESRSRGLGESSYLRTLAIALQNGAIELLEPPLPELLKRSERNSLKEGMGRLLDALELATREGCLNGECTHVTLLGQSAESCTVVVAKGWRCARCLGRVRGGVWGVGSTFLRINGAKVSEW